jgi:hypothetical protein
MEKSIWANLYVPFVGNINTECGGAEPAAFISAATVPEAAGYPSHAGRGIKT